MSFELALRLSEVILAWALIQRGVEHLRGPDKWVLAPQLMLAPFLLVGLATPFVMLCLWCACLWQLWHFRGPYNGGSDKMVFLQITCLAVALNAPTSAVAEMALAYLAVQLTLSYFVSGWIKLRNRRWLSGAALRDVFAISAYPASRAMRRWAARPHVLRTISWGVIGFEVVFPLALLTVPTTCAAVLIAGCFHLSNALCLGLNRFVWAWIGAYPALLWFQGRIASGLG